MTQDHGRLALETIHGDREESADHVEILMFGVTLIIAPSAGMFIACRTAGVLSDTRVFVNRNVLPVAIPADDVHILLLRNELPDLIAFMMKVFV